ncbi:hypothetical protein POM88_002504 [Heracleum sosnowskyi]|uniref:F-box domain-containing protein n=1 Tax=Heracleum sosnowskyi TaxID=360622 RepID=A0AAD8JG84_9APIA|nr:hypothetical protein POM88_002504 [Heracleum sosnowskyi]
MENFGNEDWISALPDELIHRILSFGVDLDGVVQTSVLSKRWVNLWSTFPYLNFKPLCSTLSDYKYRKFITKFLTNRNQQSDTCSINISLSLAYQDEFVTTMMLYYAMCHGVQKFRITSANIKSKFNFPVLRNLSLHSCLVAFMDLSLPCLTTLHLANVLNPGDNLSFKEFRCLKNLTLEGNSVLYYTMEVFRIDSPSLQTLTFLQGEYYMYPALCKFVVSAPRLEYFKYFGCYVPVFSAEGGFPCLEEAVFYINVDEYVCNWDDGNQVSETIQKLMALLRVFCQTNRLTLFLETIQVLSKVLDFSKYRPSPFVNLWWLNLVEYMPPLLGFENPIIPVNHVINYLISNSPGARVSTKLLPMSVADDDDT